ncbi:MAG: alpha/beta hydrolase [Sphingomicrobium sp.]
MKRLIAIATAILCLAVGSSGTYAEAWRPPTGATAIALWPANVTIARPEVKGPERLEVRQKPKGIRAVSWIFDVTRPTMTIVRPSGPSTGVAMLVFPGGGYRGLAIDLEGTEVCDWLTSRGIACAILKYRVPWSGPHWDDGCKCQAVPPVPMALQDAQRAMAILRSRAKEFGIDARKIGVLGFSAGGHLVADVTNADKLSYGAVDAADRTDTRPNFGVALYPGHMWAGEGVELEPFDHISAKAPPTFIIAAEDDPVDDVHNSITYFLALREAKVKAEMHIYAEGGHGFGLRRTDKPVTHWTDLVERWLHTIGILKG